MPENCVPAGDPFSPQGSSSFRDPATALSFSLTPPGARSLAMGGAFLGLADDATAAYANPAGLTNLAVGGAELAVELRGSRFSGPFPDRGHYNTDGSRNVAVQNHGEDFISGLEFEDTSGDTRGLSFLSYGFVWPGGLTMALYRHELGNYSSSFQSQGPFNTFEGEQYRVQPSRSAIDLEIVNHGISTAYEFDIGSDSSLSIGIGVAFYQAELERLSERFDVCRFDVFDPDEPDGNDICTQNEARSRQPGGFYGPADYTADNRVSVEIEDSDDQSHGFNVGFLWKLGRDRQFSVGGVFRQGTQFDTDLLYLEEEDEFGDTFTFLSADGSLTVPDVFGLGLAYRTEDRNTKFSFDWNRVYYSQTLDDFAILDVNDGNVVKIDPDTIYSLDDVDQFHFGVEHIFLVIESLVVGAARVGLGYEPAHTPRYKGANDDLKILYGQKVDDHYHTSIGLGLVLKEDYQLDMAASFSDRTDVISMSLVTFF